MTYEIAISTGYFSIARDPTILGLGRKVTSILTYGVRMVQADVETSTVAELFEPEFEKLVIQAKDQLGLRWGIHGEIGQQVAFETAIQMWWRQSHRRIHQYLDALYEKFVKPGLQKYLPEYIDFHTSQMMSIGFFAERYRLAGMITIDFKGRWNWTELFKENPELKEWYKKNLLFLVWGRESPVWGRVEEHADRARGILRAKKISEYIKTHSDEVRNITQQLTQQLGRTPVPDEIQNQILGRIEISEKEVTDQLYIEWEEGVLPKHGRGTITDEEIAHVIVAKYLELKRNDSKEPLWKLFFGEKTLEDLETKEWGTPEKPRKLVNKDTGEIYLDPELVALVACRYVIGHFEAEPLSEYLTEIFERDVKKRGDPFYKKTAKEKLTIINSAKEGKVNIVFENPEIGEGQVEGLQRIIRAKHMYNLAKAMEHPNIKLLVDFEHWLHNDVDPGKELTDSRLPKDFGSFVFACHVYYPAPVHVHMPLEISSDEQLRLYKWLILLRGLGFKEGALVFERGGGQTPLEFIKTTVFSLREIIENLDKDIPVEKLPLKFYGVSPEGIFSLQRQEAIMRQHVRDPLKGLLMVPEEEYTALGKAAIEKGKRPEEWEKEKLR